MRVGRGRDGEGGNRSAFANARPEVTFECHTCDT